MLKKLRKFIDNNAFEVISVLVVLVFLVWVFGCDSKVRSVRYPGQKVTRPELNAEIEAYLAVADIRFAQLDRQDQFRHLLIEHGLTYARTGTINPLALITSLGSILGAGALGDNVRQRRRHRREILERADTQKANGN